MRVFAVKFNLLLLKMSEKRDRAPNFSKEEEEILISLVTKHADVVENKQTDAVMWSAKKAAWEKVANEFENLAGIKRSAKNLKDKYENLKKKAKKELAEEKKEVYATGGGIKTKHVSKLSEEISAILGVAGKGLESPFDSDKIEYNNHTNEEYCEYLDIELQENAEIDPISMLEEEIDWSTYNSQKLKQPVSKKLAVKKEKSKVKYMGELRDEDSESLFQAQKIYFENEETRAAEKHVLEKEKYEFDKKYAAEKHTKEIKILELKAKLMEAELALKIKEVKYEF